MKYHNTMFRHKNDSSFIFTIKHKVDDMYDLVWEENGVPQCSHFVYVEKYIDGKIAEGLWIIEKENNMKQTNVKQMEATVAELLAKAEELKQLIEKEKQKEDVWPAVGHAYYWINGGAMVDYNRWDNDSVDNDRMLVGNVFRTKEDAEKALAKRKIETKLHNLAYKAWIVMKRPKWFGYNTPNKYHLCYDHCQNIFEVDENTTVQHIGQIFFPTEQSAKDAVKEIGEDNLKLLFM